ncbi:MAG TPA: T9SS type A sorting domain-containing protein [Paludibacteraceae bacterium]|nr:T9SS type A sorting domain-containing protein [Paludibacteraceae bacterium]
MRKLLFFALLTMLSASLIAQSMERWVVSGAGGIYLDNSNNFEMDYTIGEPIITTASGASIILTQGFQQPFFIMTSLPETIDNSAEWSFYPNPVAEHLFIVNDKPGQGTYVIQLFDMMGQLLVESSRKSAGNTSLTLMLDFDGYATGNYFVRLLYQHKALKTFKIIKINQ